MQNDMSVPTIGLISGAYSSILWNNLEDLLTGEESTAHIHDVLKALQDCGRDKEAFAFVRVLYDITGLATPDDVEILAKNESTRKVYTNELIQDIENMI